MLEILQEADMVLNACGRPVAPAGFRYVDLPRVIPFFQQLAGVQVTPFQGRIANTSDTMFICRGVSLKAAVGMRLRWPDGKYLNQFPSVGGNAFPFGQGSNMLCLDERELAPGGRISVEMSALAPGASLPSISTPPASVPVPLTDPTKIVFGPTNITGNEDFSGPWVFGNALYVITLKQFSTGVLTIWRSTDGGNTWIAQDTANQPTTAPAGYSVARNLFGSKLEIVGRTAAHDIFLKTFDCATNTWGPSSVPAGLATVEGAAVVVQPDGTRWVFFEHTGAANTLNVIQLSPANVWSGVTVVVTAAGGRHVRLLGVWLDASDTSNVLYVTADQVGGLNGVFSYITVTTSLVVSAPVTMDTLAAALQPTGASQTAYSAGLTANGTFMTPERLNSTPVGRVPNFIIGNAVAGFVVSSPDPGGLTIPAGCFADGVCAITLADGRMVGFYQVRNPTTGLVDQIWGAIWNGVAWTTPVLVYDAVANPPAFTDPPSPLQDVLGALSVAVLPNNGIALYFSLTVTITGFAPGFPGFFASGFLGAAGVVEVALWGVLRYILKETQCAPRPSWCSTSPKSPKLYTMPDPVALYSKMPRLRCGPNQNIMAPEFLLGNQCCRETPDGKRDESFTFFSGPITVPAGGQNYNNVVIVPGSDDVVIKSITAFVTFSGGLTFTIPTLAIRLPNGYAVTGGDMVPLSLLPGGAVVFPTLRIAAGGRIILDMADTQAIGSVGASTTVIQFDGVKRRKAAA